MILTRPDLLRRIRSFLQRPWLLVVLGTCLFVSNAAGELPFVYNMEGYVTAVHSPTSFDVNVRPVTTSSDTRYGYVGDKNPMANSPLRNAIRVGVWVHVLWADGVPHTMPAATVYLRDDADKQLSGVGIIDKMIAAGAEPVFQADGYRIRITKETQVSFQGALKGLTGVGTNVLVHFEGKRDATGELVASKADFASVDPKRLDPVQIPTGQVPVPSGGAIIDMDGKLKSPHTKVRYQESDDFCGWFRAPGDAALQERVQRVGMRLVPAYQKQLAADSPSKIDFRFYAVDKADFRTDLFCRPGLIMVPRQVVERLKNDDQLAAVLADGIAANLQWQVARLLMNKAVRVTADVADATEVTAMHTILVFDNLSTEAIYAGVDIALNIAVYEIYIRLEEQRDRMTLAMMADAGYDPWQAPEAWRLLGPRKLPRDANTLSYPSRSGYQLGILNLQYRQSGAAPAAASK